VTMTRSAALVLSLLFAALAFAQSDVSTSEFGRGTGGEISLITKSPARLSGSFGISTGGLGGRRNGYDATLGGTVVQDRIWFFASAQRSTDLFGATPQQNGESAEAVSRAIDAKLAMQLGNRQNLAATFASQRGIDSALATPGVTPSSFLSLRYTGIVSDHMFFNASFSRSSGARSINALDPR
jgi:hypothetical protein